MTYTEISDITFALGSSQYSGIYREYTEIRDKKRSENDPSINPLEHRQSMVNQYSTIILDLKDIILEDEGWLDEQPGDLWKSLNLKLQLLNRSEATTYDLQKRMLKDIFSLLKCMSWDLWGALNFMHEACPELKSFVTHNTWGDTDETAEYFGMIIYYFGSVIDLTDEEVRDIFGDFST